MGNPGKPHNRRTIQQIRICGECGKKVPFLIDYSDYVYKIYQPPKKMIYYCSYTCWRKALKKAEEEKLEQKQKQKEKLKNLQKSAQKS